MSLRELFYARDITTMRRVPVGLPVGCYDSWGYDKQFPIKNMIIQRIRAIWNLEYGPRVNAPVPESPYPRDLIIDIRMIWDYAQHSLWNSICWSSPQGPQESMFEEPKLHLWDAEEGDELLIQEVRVKPAIHPISNPVH